MPLYEYECTACGHRFERIQKFSDPPVDECPSCGEPSVQKLLSSPAIQFKGTGWYITDYARKSAGADAKIPGDASKDSKDMKDSKDSKDSKGTDSKTTTDAGASSSSSTSSTSSTPKASGE